MRFHSEGSTVIDRCSSIAIPGTGHPQAPAGPREVRAAGPMQRHGIFPRYVDHSFAHNAYHNFSIELPHPHSFPSISSSDILPSLHPYVPARQHLPWKLQLPISLQLPLVRICHSFPWFSSAWWNFVQFWRLGPEKVRYGGDEPGCCNDRTAIIAIIMRTHRRSPPLPLITRRTLQSAGADPTGAADSRRLFA